MPKLNKLLAEGTNGTQVWMHPTEATVLEVLEHCNKGGVACVHDYVATTGRISPETANYQVITRFNYSRLLQRKLIALQDITLNEVDLDVIPDPKLKGKTRKEWFAIAHAELVASAEKTLDNDRSDSRRAGHDRCFVPFASGVKAHLVTEKREDGLMHPVLTNGFPTVPSIKLSVVILNKTVTIKGEYKHVNSGAKVLAKKAINKVLNQRSVGLRTLSLKAENFSRLTIDHNEVEAEDIRSLMD